MKHFLQLQLVGICKEHKLVFFLKAITTATSADTVILLAFAYKSLMGLLKVEEHC